MKNSRFVQFFYNIPGVSSTYHFVWAWARAKINRNPSRHLFVIGVTGTKGKTTTLELLNAILETAGRKTALLSSLRIKTGDKSKKNQLGNSMPGRGYIQKFLVNALREGCGYALIEVTSQGVVAHRHRFIDWGVGVITNLAPEHIESHGSFENYRKAKLDFLKYVLKKGGQVFLNRDDPHFPFFERALGRPVPSYSKTDPEPARFLEKMDAPSFARRESGGKFLLTAFNEENVAVAVAVAQHLGIGDKAIEKALTTFQGVPGRMEFLTKGPYTAVVDYAHTPESLEAAYVAAKPEPNANYPDARFVCVLGAAGGGRDRWKRAEFGKIAAQYCDEIILTNEDPYNEDPEQIVREIREGALAAGADPENVHVVIDREEAIKGAVSLLQPGGVAIGTGKGSEDWIHVARNKKIPWNEREVFEKALAEK